MYGPFDRELGKVEKGHIRIKTKEERKYYDLLGAHLTHFFADYALFRKIVKAIYPEAKETDIQKYSVAITSNGRRGKAFGIWIEGYGKHAEEVPAWEYPKLSLFYRLLTALTAMKYNLDIENAYRALSVELPKRLGHRVPKPEEINEIERTVNELVREGMLPERAKRDVIDLAKELSQIVYELFPRKESALEHREKVIKQIKKYRKWGIEEHDLGVYWYEVVLEDVLKKHSKNITEIMRREAAQQPTPTTVPTKTITQKIPSEVEEAFKALKGMGVDLKLETGNVAERKAKIYAWLMQNGLIHVEQEGEKVRIIPTEKMHQLIAKHGKTAGAILKWAAEEGVGLEHVEPVGRIVSALEELRQIAKKKDPALAKTLEKAMKSKHTIKELYYLLQGEYAPEDLSKRWSEQFGRVDFYRLFEQYPELAKATLKAMEEMEKKGLTAPPVPRYWTDLLRDLREGKVDQKKIEEYLAFTTYGKHVFNSLHSIAGEELPEDGKEIEALIKNVMTHNRGVAEAVLTRIGVSEEAKARGMEYLERNVEQLAQIIAHMKDPNHLDRVERKIAPILEKLPAKGRRIGLFKKEKSPREKVEDLAEQVVNVIRAGAKEEDIQDLFRQAAKLKEELRQHIGEQEADRLVRMITAPAVAEMWKKRLNGRDPAKEYVKIVAQDNLHRFIGLEPKLKEIRRTMPTGEEAVRAHDDLVRHLTTWELQGTMVEREPFLKRIRTKEALKNIVERHYG
ncbi:hypothetical protein [Thermococcus stetteri]|uniref:hypothetical protein n=1 Tax=Thermococcus stetteri TaxID=49900 RepID=UPI001AE2768C|nr:hypothetical protein [Thermococcus stetteri]MBP1912528.1 hypothetical protein [Thermococcus stetteri]